MVKKTKPKKEYGYYCDLCGNKICKYEADFRSCGGHTINLPHKISNKVTVEFCDICHDCAKEVMEDILASLKL